MFDSGRNPKPLVIQLSGGLGNQLFQYVFGKWLAERLGLPLKADLSELEGDRSTHGLTLQDVGVEAEFCNIRNELGPFRYFCHRLAVFIQRKFPNRSRLIPGARNVYSSPVLGLDPNADSASRISFVRGYFQSWKYFHDLASAGWVLQINPAGLTDWFHEQMSHIQTDEPVVVHVRRGDYLTQGSDWGVLEADYYIAALKHLGVSESDRVWIFSDDLDAAREMLGGLISAETYWVEPPKNTMAIESLLLMASARRIVIANSTFSWWAARLGPNTKQVVAPEKWFRSKTAPEDLLPPEWARVRSF